MVVGGVTGAVVVASEVLLVAGAGALDVVAGSVLVVCTVADDAGSSAVRAALSTLLSEIDVTEGVDAVLVSGFEKEDMNASNPVDVLLVSVVAKEVVCAELVLVSGGVMVVFVKATSLLILRGR